MKVQAETRTIVTLEMNQIEALWLLDYLAQPKGKRENRHDKDMRLIFKGAVETGLHEYAAQKGK